MRAYLDICALKRPFDDQRQPRLRLEADAVLELLAAPVERLAFIHSAAQDLENGQNPLAWRAVRVAARLAGVPRSMAKPEELSAELVGADVFATTDDWLLALGARHAALLRVGVVALAQEVFR